MTQEELLTKIKKDPENEVLRRKAIEEFAKAALKERAAVFEELAK